MTEKKRQQKRSTSGGTKSRSSSSSSKTSAAGRKKAAEADERRIDSRVRDEIVSIILIAVGIFFIIAFQTSAAGAIGMSLSHFFKGLFGFAAYTSVPVSAVISSTAAAMNFLRDIFICAFITPPPSVCL